MQYQSCLEIQQNIIREAKFTVNVSNVYLFMRMRYQVELLNVAGMTKVPLYSVDTCPGGHQGKDAGDEVDKDTWRVAFVAPCLPQFVQT